MSEATPFHNVKQAVPFFAVTDMARSLDFYVMGLGCAMTKDWTVDGELRWCWLQLGEAALMLQQVAAEGHGSGPLDGRAGQGVTISFVCEDAIDFYREMKDQGLAPTRPFVGNHMWVTSIQDPDGYRLNFESPTDMPEDTEFDEPSA
ncbi:MAG: VOC family protein [Vicinamibacteria bacterium]